MEPARRVNVNLAHVPADGPCVSRKGWTAPVFERDDTSDFIPRGSNAFSSHEPMPTDLQIIDGFEALRQNFKEENPSV